MIKQAREVCRYLLVVLGLEGVSQGPARVVERVVSILTTLKAFPAMGVSGSPRHLTRHCLSQSVTYIQFSLKRIPRLFSFCDYNSWSHILRIRVEARGAAVHGSDQNPKAHEVHCLVLRVHWARGRRKG